MLLLRILPKSVPSRKWVKGRILQNFPCTFDQVFTNFSLKLSVFKRLGNVRARSPIKLRVWARTQHGKKRLRTENQFAYLRKNINQGVAARTRASLCRNKKKLVKEENSKLRFVPNQNSKWFERDRVIENPNKIQRVQVSQRYLYDSYTRLMLAQNKSKVCQL